MHDLMLVKSIIVGVKQRVKIDCHIEIQNPGAGISEGVIGGIRLSEWGLSLTF